MAPQQQGQSCTKSRLSFVFQPRAWTVPLTLCTHTHECWWRGVLTLTGRLTRTTWSGQGRVPIASGAVSTEERGAYTQRGRHSCSHSGHLPWLLGTCALAVRKVTNTLVNPSPLLSPERDIHPGPSCSPISLLPGCPPAAPSPCPQAPSNPTRWPPRLSTESPPHPPQLCSGLRQPLCAQASRPLPCSGRSSKLHGVWTPG